MLQPGLRLEYDGDRIAAACVGVHNLDPDLVSRLDESRRTGPLLRSVLRVSVIEPEMNGCGERPDVLGRHQILDTGVRFIPRFPFEPGVRYRASFDPRPLGYAGLADALMLEFSLPNPVNVEPTSVTAVFPSADVLPENLLRFYVCFSRPMRRGRAEAQITLLGPDGRPVPDALYRPPVELWDRSMRCLTVLLDPGRLKRRVGPNRQLGPPLKAGTHYALAIGSEMLDSAGRSLCQSFFKPFVAAEAVREAIALARWKVRLPAPKSCQPLKILFPGPLDWALLWHSITVVPDGGAQIRGRISIDLSERQWNIAPSSPWAAGGYSIRVASDLEDACGNSVFAPFDRRLRPGRDLAVETGNCSIPFKLTNSLHQPSMR
jgi:hypothetical protein